MDGGTASGVGPALGHAFRLDAFTIDPLAGTIAGPAGEVHVDPKVMDVLVTLARRAGEVVPRQALLAEVWQGRIVSDDVVSRCVYQLRRHLVSAGGSGHLKALLETIPKRGYRLNCAAPTEVSGVLNERMFDMVPRAPPDAKRIALLKGAGWTTLVACVVLAVTVLWMAKRPDPPQVVTKNSRAYDAWVRANEYFKRADRQTALPYAVGLYQQAVELDPGYVDALAGLAKAHTDMYWHGVDRTPSRLEQAEKTLQQMFALDADLPEAYLAKANFLLKGRNDYSGALHELDVAEKSFPENPELFFLRAMANRRLGNWSLSIDALETALKFDSRNVSYLRQQYVNYLFVRKYDDADRSLSRILQLFPDDGTAFVDKVVLGLCRDGDTTLARQYAKEPPSAFFDEGLAYTYTSWLAAIFDQAYEQALRVLDESDEDPIFDGDLRNASFGPKALFYARTHRLAGNELDAKIEFSAIIRMLGEQPFIGVGADAPMVAARYLALAEAQAGLGQPERALESVRYALALIPETVDALTGSALLLSSVIRVLVPAGYHEEALRELDQYLAGEGHWSIEGLAKDPRLEPLRSRPGFHVLVQKYRATRGNVGVQFNRGSLSPDFTNNQQTMSVELEDP